MRILQLCHKPLSGRPDGGKLAMKSLAEGLRANGAEVFSWMIETPSHPASAQDRAQGISKSFFIDTRVKVFPALRDLLGGESYNLSRFASEAACRDISDVIATFKPDVILAEGIFTLAGWMKHGFGKDLPVVLRSHNIEHLIWDRMAEAESNPLKRWYLRRLALALKKEEQEIWEKSDAIIAISDQDAAVIAASVPQKKLSTVSIGFDIPPKAEMKFSGTEFFHIGAMDWRPNREGMEHFLRDVWPVLKRDHPSIVCRIAGKGMPAKFGTLENEGVFVVKVDDAQEFMRNSGVMIVPLLSGSGVRVKIIEGLMQGIPLITSAIGKEGIPAVAGKHLFEANDLESYRLIFNKLTAHPELLNEVSENALT
ncbi:MAG: glycosyltransferase family 4 protein, partial [Bacteroidetes bacterium]|nr:glycosyltransferase family 4 protein [Bacteroidota bacterium]